MDPSFGLSFLELWRATGPLARVVVCVLGAMSLAAGAVATEKWLRLRRAERESDAFLATWREKRGGEQDAALARRFPASPVAALLVATSATSGLGSDVRREVYDRTIRRHVLATGSELRRGLSLVATVGSTAPFVGLFGTVVGIVNAFREIAGSGRGGVATVSTGIAEALVTTAFGIMVAIPAVWLFNHLSQRIARLLIAVECAGEELAIAELATERLPADVRAEAGAVPSWR